MEESQNVLSANIVEEYNKLSPKQLHALHRENHKSEQSKKMRQYCREKISKIFPALSETATETKYGTLLAGIARSIETESPNYEYINEYICLLLQKHGGGSHTTKITDEIFQCREVSIFNNNNNQSAIIAFENPGVFRFFSFAGKNKPDEPDGMKYLISQKIISIMKTFFHCILPIFVNVKKLSLNGDTSMLWHIRNKACARISKLSIDSDLCDDDFRKIVRFTQLTKLKLMTEKNFILPAAILTLEYLKVLTISEKVILCPQIKQAKNIREINIMFDDEPAESQIKNKLYMLDKPKYVTVNGQCRDYTRVILE